MSHLKQRMAYELSGFDLQEFVPESKVLLHSDIDEYDNIDELFVNRALPNVTFINYEAGSTMTAGGQEAINGHWSLIIDKGDHIVSFDPYGGSLEKQYSYVKGDFREDPHLIDLLLESNLPVDNNTFKFQKQGKGINTCGKHCVLRALFEDLTNSQYKDLIQKATKNAGFDKNYDMFVTFIFDKYAGM